MPSASAFFRADASELRGDRDDVHEAEAPDGVDVVRADESGADQSHSDSPRATRAPFCTYSNPFFTSSTGVPAPLYSYSMFAGIGHLFCFSSCSTSRIGVSPWPHGVLSPWFFLRSLMCRFVMLA